MSHKSYLRILQFGAIVSLFFVLLVSKSLLFPYISTKQVSYNILMELLLVVYLIFIFKYPTYRPKANLVTYGLLAYLAIILLSAFTGVDFNLSFWSDTERMLGFFQILHYFIFYLILISAFRSWRDWRLLLNASVLAALAVSLYGLLGPNSYSTIGNTAYVSGYLIFNLFFLVILFLRERRQWRYLYLLPGLIILLQFVKMKTSGAIIGLFAGLFVALILLLIFHCKRSFKLKLSAILLIAVLALGFVFSQQEASWFQNSFLRNLTSQKNTFQTRWLSWQGAAKDFHRHPIIGTGFGNFAISFDRQFNPAFFDYDSVDTYFDRAHNNLIDIASTTGILGLLAYLSIFVFALVYIIQQARINDGLKISQIKSPVGRKNLELIVILALLVAYFVQNLAIFDSFTTYNGLMILLAFIVFLRQEDVLKESPEASFYQANPWFKGSREFRVLVISLLLIYLVINQLNVKPLKLYLGTIDAYRLTLSGQVRDGFSAFKESLDDSQFSRDARLVLINLSINNPNIFSSLEPDQKQEEFDYVLSLAHKNLSYNPLNNASLMKMAQLYELGAKLFLNDEVKSQYYAQESLAYVERAIAASPGRMPAYYAKSQALVLLGRLDEAQASLEYALELNPNYGYSYCLLGSFYLSQDNLDLAKEPLEFCVDKDGIKKLSSSVTLANTATFFIEAEDYERAILIVQRMIVNNEEDPEMWFNLFKLYLMDKDLDNARLIAPQVINLAPDYEDDVNLFLKQVELELEQGQEEENSEPVDLEQ